MAAAVDRCLAGDLHQRNNLDHPGISGGFKALVISQRSCQCFQQPGNSLPVQK
jgi:hypothetical protein